MTICTSRLVLAGLALVVSASTATAGEVALNFTQIKIDGQHTQQACRDQGGEIVIVTGSQSCKLPNQGGAPGVWKAPAGSAPAASKIELTGILVSSVKTGGASTTPPK